MERDDAIAVLKRQIKARGELPVTDAIAALVSIGIQAEAEITAIITDAVGVEWAARRERGGVVLLPLRSQRAPSGLPWGKADDRSVCHYCAADTTIEGAKSDPPVCAVCLALLEYGGRR